MADYISERKAGQIIGDSVRLYLKNLPVIFAIYILPLVPVIFIEAATFAEGDLESNWIAVGAETVLTIFTLGAMTVAVSDICLGNRASIMRSYGALFRVFWSYLGAYLIYLVATMVGLVLLVVPGIAAMLVLMFCLPAAIIERRGPIESCKRSIQLGKGYYWRNFGVILLAILVGVVAMLIISAILVVVMLVTDMDPLGFTFNFLNGVLASVAAPLFQIPAILLYYDMRARKEHFDGAALAQELLT